MIGRPLGQAYVRVGGDFAELKVAWAYFSGVDVSMDRRNDPMDHSGHIKIGD